MALGHDPGGLHMDPSERQTLLKFYCAASMMPKRSTCFVKRVLGLHTSLSNLTARRLLLLIVLYALASPALHQTWSRSTATRRISVSAFS